MSERKYVTFPKSDTIAGPGTYEGEVTVGDNGEIESIAVDPKEEIDEIGAATAKDVTSTNQTPRRYK